MADNDGSEDREQSEGGVDVPELALGITLIGLGAVLVFKALAAGQRSLAAGASPRQTLR